MSDTAYEGLDYSKRVTSAKTGPAEVDVSGGSVGLRRLGDAERVGGASTDPMLLLRQVASRLWEQAPGGDQDAPVGRQELVEALLEADAFLEEEHSA